jgi:hypothetical protein
MPLLCKFLFFYLKFGLIKDIKYFIRPKFLTSFTDHQNLYWINFDMFSHASVWFCIIAAIVASLIPDTVVKTIENLIECNKVNKIKEIEK